MKKSLVTRVVLPVLTVSAMGIATLIGYEGSEKTGYLDSVGVPTVCYGHTATAEVGVTFSEEHCEYLLRKDLQEFSHTVNTSITVPLSQPMFDSLVSFCYNVGSHACRTSTMFRLINAREYRQAIDQFDRWVYAGGRDCRIRSNNCYGVYTRRMAEKAMFAEGVDTLIQDLKERKAHEKPCDYCPVDGDRNPWALYGRGNSVAAPELAGVP